MSDAFPYPPGTWVLWNQSMPGSNRPFVGYVVAVLPPGKGEDLPGDAAEALGERANEFNSNLLVSRSLVASGEPRPLIAVPDIREGKPFLVSPDPRRVSALRTADQPKIDLGALQTGSHLQVRSAVGRSAEVTVEGRRLGVVRECSVHLRPDRVTEVRLVAGMPDMSIDGRIVFVAPFDPTAEL